ncbi:SusC/RagA family TonB-linked outer membrane protein [Pedobacter sp. P26]|uniref:SusC/RagA family TonB-linked outer membrane protein n=1 Tax=Pedobacter sp. P26 TaxID=3423956 RepID=UPI003D6692DC
MLKAQSITGDVHDKETGNIISGASIRSVKNRTVSTSDENGVFKIVLIMLPDTLIASKMGYSQLKIAVQTRTLINITLVPASNQLEDVTVSTGYQTISKERATGSFEVIDNKMLNRRTGTDVLSRLEGITTGLQFDRRGQSPDQSAASAGNIVIRGISTLSSNIKTPLIVLDNFPYEGDILNINPSDIEQVTVLKDAAAASIWGARAGNGVIVITTKKGKINSSTKITLGANLIVSEKPNLFKYPSMSSSDFIDIEQYLFRQGFYDSALGNNTTYPVLSPAVEIFDQSRKKLISRADSLVLVDQLKSRDIRKDFDKNLYRNGISQQYNLGINGGSEKMAYAVSAGFDKNFFNQMGNSYQRITLRAQNTYKPIKNIEILFGLQYSSSISENNSPGGISDIQYASGKNLYPYAQLADDSGNPVYFAKNYRSGYLDTAGRGKLMNWQYSPLDELANANNTNSLQGILINTGIRYRISDSWAADLKYQFEENKTAAKNLYNQRTFLTRDLINQFTLLQGEKITYRVPLGSILNSSNSTLGVHSARAQLSYNKQWNKHNITGIAGFEVRDGSTKSNYDRTYGYDENTLSISGVDYITNFTKYGKLGTGRIPFNTGFTQLENRFVSMYANAAYTFKERYILSGSIRRDASNIFGASTNNKWKPLWSSGFAWEISREGFYSIGFLPMLKLRATYGVSGNTNNSISSIPILSYSSGANNIIANLQNATILSGGNPNLTWESVRTLNLGLDFSMTQSRVSGSIEWYSKRTDDLIAGQLIDPTTGFGGISSNSGGMLGEGVDITLNTLNLNGAFKWSTTLLFSRASAKITKIKNDVSKRQGLDYALGDGSLILQAQDTNPYALWAFKWGGLDSKTGNPIGYLNSEASQDYTAILNGTLVEDLVYKGTALPLISVPYETVSIIRILVSPLT